MTALMRLQQVQQWLPGATLIGSPEREIARVHTDSRSIAPGDLFVALKGHHYDANEFLRDAQERGAAAVLCHRGLPAGQYPAQLPRIEVADTRVALGQLGQAWRAQFALPLIAVTGSNGKTTVTQMLAAILNAFAPGGASLATRGNLNNDIGVPMTLLELRAQHRIAAVEIGMNHPGEIAALAALVRPTVALVNNAQREHLEFMHTVQAVAEENGAVIASLPADGVAIFPADDTFAPLWQDRAAGRRVLRFALEGAASEQDLVCLQAQWSGAAWQVRAGGLGVELNYRLAIAGRHNVKNSLAAAACALAGGVSAQAVEQGLAAFAPVKGRSRAMEILIAGRQRTVVDDSYNANPDSVRAAIDVLAQLPGPRLLVLGDMGEVGQQGPQFHAEAGRYAASMGIEGLLATGTLSQHAVHAFPAARHFDSMGALCAGVIERLPQFSSLLVKGSRFMRMERVIDTVMATLVQPTEGEAPCW
jgi:UDP-N-acetylmuramoyl-tripeptide--D-alanyl-D-alanine ligase